DFGIKCIIAPSFADIFYNNCFKNGILPIILEQKIIDQLMEVAKKAQKITIDLPNNQITLTDGRNFKFEVDPFRKECLILGLDDIALNLQKENEIKQFELRNKQQLPWLYQ